MNKKDIAREFRCLGYDARIVRNGVVVSLNRTISEMEINMAFNQAIGYEPTLKRLNDYEILIEDGE